MKEMKLKQINDIKGNVRNDGQYYSLKSFIQPFDPLVMEIASILNTSSDPISAAQDFVHRVVQYERENGEMWRYPRELLMLEPSHGDCDDMAILLCSILRSYIPANDVYVVVGDMLNGKDTGHAWVLAHGEIIESTASSSQKINKDRYRPEVLFNDKYAYGMSNSFGFIVAMDKYNLKVGDEYER